jgi:hypothetical protein
MVWATALKPICSGCGDASLCDDPSVAQSEVEPAAARAASQRSRPTTLLLVYTWDILLAIGALIEGVFAPFGGAVEVGGRTLETPVAVQILEAISSAMLAAALVVVGTLLTRHSAWVRRAQMVVLGMAAVIGVASFAVVEALARSLDVFGLTGTLLLVLVDVLAIFAMTSSRAAAWFDEPGQVPLYVGGLIAFWAASSVAFVTLRALS